jgi:hypothetical protein
MTPDERLLRIMLDRLEQREARLLAWGLVDGHLSTAEIRQVADELLDDPDLGSGVRFSDAAAVIAALRARSLVLDVGEVPAERYRTRMAETVRLAFRLRQLFPKHDGPTGWQTAPTLVADFRFLWRRRRYPRRSIAAQDALATITAACADARVRQSLADLLTSYGPDFRLADFQVAAAARVLRGLENGTSTATLVSAGTGSGKTIAFYLPALSRIAAHIQRETATTRWVKVLALYPRNELLKDQFVEVYGQARRLDSALRRKILIGAYFGPTAYDAADAVEKRGGWRRHPRGSICEYARCPAPGCGGDMIWPEADRVAGRERLECLDCQHEIGGDEIVLTRARLEREAPDILFTTTEMLNQRLGDDRIRHLFGVGERARYPVEMMLLDEVHTYAGSPGAQTAYLLQRWRRMLRRPVSFVGLSATLKDGGRFFARITGTPEAACLEITPAENEMISEGAEYLLALRGDPVSRAALLSTTIQTSMLLSRMLDAPDSRRSGGLFGERVFLFTDDIDVTNRMYFSMLDAEGRLSGGGFDMVRHPGGGLAVLRRPMPSQARKLHGQDWSAAVEIGHTLQAQERKSVGRTMALDPGVDAGRDIIVATASLEVGFNDQGVGGVIQHKAPRDNAQFLQRKGRAGRSRDMRPWTVAVLSDYGRDRLAYQGYDLLFDPELPPRALPTGNRHVLRIQAIYATLDYLSLTMGPAAPAGSVWSNLAGPTDARSHRQRERQQLMARRIKAILTSPLEQDRYARHLVETLKAPAEEADLLLWEHPRPLLTEVLPTALRRLESNWAANGIAGADYQVRNSPLPEFAPANLFSDLNLPEVTIALPAVFGRQVDPMVMPVAQAMREFAPGRVSRRYGLDHALQRHWLCPQLDANLAQDVDVAATIQAEALGDWRVWISGIGTPLPVLRPRVVTVTQPSRDVLDSSNAQLEWRTQAVARQAGLDMEPPVGGPWRAFIPRLSVHTHQGLNPIEMRRMALGSEAAIRFENGQEVRKRFRFTRDDAPVALGFSLSVDALRLAVRPPEHLWADVAADDVLRRAVRTARFYDEVSQGVDLAIVDNPFAREWLGQLLLAALSNEAIAKGIGLDQAAANLAAGTADLDLDQTLVRLFQSALVDDANAQGNTQDRLRQDLQQHLANPLVRQALFQLAPLLWGPIDATWRSWLEKRFVATVAAAAFSALLSLCPDVDSADLVVDLDGGPPEDDDVTPAEAGVWNIWISELSPGGNGHVETWLQQYADDPRRFFGLMTAALRENDFSLSDYQLGRFLETVVEGEPTDPVPTATRDLRAASGTDPSHAAFSELRRALAELGFVTFHAFLVALNNRILRPGSSGDSDAFLLEALRRWDQEEVRLGVELDARVVAYNLARRSDLDAALAQAGVGVPTVHIDQWRFGVIYSLLWPRGGQIRRSGLNLYSAFADLPAAEPLLVRPYLDLNAAVIDIRAPDWSEACLARLAHVGAVTLACPIGESPRLAAAFNLLATNPVQTDYLSVFARIQGVRRVRDEMHVDVDIAEALQ